MKFQCVNIFCKSYIFSERDAPDWLTGKNQVKGSTMDNSWFYREKVLRLSIGETIDTDFSIITRIE